MNLMIMFLSTAAGITIGFINLSAFTLFTMQPSPPLSTAKIVPIASHLTEKDIVIDAKKAPSPTAAKLLALRQGK